jgi:hypothetical protein
LESLVAQLSQQKVVSIRVASRAEAGLEGDGSVVTGIVIEELKQRGNTVERRRVCDLEKVVYFF